MGLCLGFFGATAQEGEGFDLRFLEQRAAYAEAMSRHLLTVEVEIPPPPPYSADHPLRYDGVAVVIAPGRAVTTATYLFDATELTLTGEGGARFVGEVIRRDARLDLALLSFPPAASPSARPVPGVTGADLPREGDNAVGQAIMPSVIGGEGVQIREAALRWDEGTLYLSGPARNGVPAFDERLRLVALARTPTPDMLRSSAVSAESLRAFLGSVTTDESARRGGADKKPAPR